MWSLVLLVMAPVLAGLGSLLTHDRRVVEALQYYKGYRYSETVEVAVVLPRLGYSICNDVVVPVPVLRSRTRLTDGAIDAVAMVGAWWRVLAGRHRPSDMPAWSIYVFPLLAVFGLLFIAGDLLANPFFLASDSAHNYAHIWYISDQIFDHGDFPIHVSLLDSGRATAFPYGFAPYLFGALIFPLFGDWAVTLLMAIAVVGTVVAAAVVRPAMRDPWLVLVFLLKSMSASSASLPQSNDLTIPNSVLTLMWASACSKIFCKLGRFGVIASRNDFLSLSKAVFFRMSAPGSPLPRLPTRVSSRSAVVVPVSRMTNATSPTTVATATNEIREIIKGVIVVAFKFLSLVQSP